MRFCGIEHHEAWDQRLANGPGTAEYQMMVIFVNETESMERVN